MGSVRLASVVVLLTISGCTGAAPAPPVVDAADDATLETAGETPSQAAGVLSASVPDSTGGTTAATPSPGGDLLTELDLDTSEPIPEGTEVVAFGLHGVLDIHARPGVAGPPIAHLTTTRPLATTGRSRRVLHDEWVEVKLRRGRRTGWVDRRFVGVLGRTEEIASDLPASERAYVGGDELDLGIRVLDVLDLRPHSGEPIVSSAPGGQQPHTIAFDVREGGDARIGVRVRVTARPSSPQGGDVALERVERTRVCSRGVRPGGACL